MSPYTLQVLLHILSNEQELLKRTDQKASTLMSTLGVFMVFFIVHFKHIIMAPIPLLGLITLYFIAAFVTIGSLLMVMSPRIRNREVLDAETKHLPNPTFFAGIAKYDTQDQYRQHLDTVLTDEKVTYEIFASNIFAIGHINAMKFRYFNIGMRSFAVAIAIELIIIVSMYISTPSGVLLGK